MTDHLSREHIVEGADPTSQAEYQQATPEQVWMQLLNAAWPVRREMIALMLAHGETARNCMMSHDDIAHLRHRSWQHSDALRKINRKLMTLEQSNPSTGITKVAQDAMIDMLTDLRERLTK